MANEHPSAIASPPPTWDGPVAVLDATHKHEMQITGKINDLLEVAMKAGDYATGSMLQWFVTEQVEEEANAELILQQLRMAAESRSALFMLDREMAARPMPTAATMA